MPNLNLIQTIIIIVVYLLILSLLNKKFMFRKKILKLMRNKPIYKIIIIVSYCAALILMRGKFEGMILVFLFSFVFWPGKDINNLD